jgi:hypothetical protein
MHRTSLIVRASLAASLALAATRVRAQDSTRNPDLARIVAEDQADRRGAPADFARLSPAEQDSLDRWIAARDSGRRAQVLALVAAGAAHTAADYYNAAVVMQHGRDTVATHQAHEWANRAMQMDSTNASVRYLVAASWDRLQIGRGQPQWYGTSVRRGADGTPKLAPIDTTRVTDARRKWMTGWTLAERRAFVARPPQARPSPAGAQAPAGARTVATSRFELYSDPWVYVHHFLYQWSRADQGLSTGRQRGAV